MARVHQRRGELLREGLESSVDSNPTAAPLVTVITPAYNRADYLEEVIASVLAQDYANVEYIVLDDGSTDGTAALLSRYAGRLMAMSHANMGEARTVNRGFKLASGDIIGVVNSDDPLLPGAIRRAVETLSSDPELLVVYPDWNMIDAGGTVVQHIETHDYNYIAMIRWHDCVPGPGAFFRRTLVEQLHGRDPQFRYVADFDFWLRAGLLGPFRRIPETLATFRLHAEGGTTAGRGAEMAQEHPRLARKIFALPSVPKDVLRVRRAAFSSANYIAGVVGSDGPSLARLRYFVLAFAYAPGLYLAEDPSRLRIMVRGLRPGFTRDLRSRAQGWLAPRARRGQR